MGERNRPRDRAAGTEYVKASINRHAEEQREENARREHEMQMERRSRARLRALVAVFAVAALIAGTLTIVATDQSSRADGAARIASARELAAASIANLAVDPDLSILLARAAVDRTRAVDGSVLPEAEEALHRAVTASRLVTSLAEGTERMDWGETGVVTAGSRGIVTVRDPDDGATPRTIWTHAGFVTDVAVSADGSTLATSGRDGALRVWGADGSPRWEASGGGPTRGISLSADGARIAAAWTSPAEVQVFDVSTGARVARFRGVDATETALNLDGSAIAIVTASRKGKVLDARIRPGS